MVGPSSFETRLMVAFGNTLTQRANCTGEVLLGCKSCRERRHACAMELLLRSNPTPQADGREATHFDQPSRAPAVGRESVRPVGKGRRSIRKEAEPCVHRYGRHGAMYAFGAHAPAWSVHGLACTELQACL